MADESKAQEPAFDNCWADTETSRCVLKIGGVEFRLRCLTAGEAARISAETRTELPRFGPSDEERMLYARSLNKETGDLTTAESEELNRLATQPIVGRDGAKALILTVAAALGAWKRFGDEGWSHERAVTESAVAALREEVLVRLYQAYQDHFRPGSGPVAES